jgi:hypothetical protein
MTIVCFNGRSRCGVQLLNSTNPYGCMTWRPDVKDPVSVTALCDNCKKRPGTEHWAGHMGTEIALRRLPSLPLWCRICCLESSIAYIKERMAALPELERELAELKGGDTHD